MGSKTIVYRQKVLANLDESFKHLLRLKGAFNELEKFFVFPVNENSYNKIIENIQYLAYSDQLIYRFSKLQDSMGAKLYNVPTCQDHLNQHSYFTHYATSSNSCFSNCKLLMKSS